jgi:hypothetical protein
VAGCCECGDEPSGSCATELVNAIYRDIKDQFILLSMNRCYQLHFQIINIMQSISFQSNFAI